MNCKKCGDVLRNSSYGSFCEDCYCDALLGYPPLNGANLSAQAKKMYEKVAKPERKKKGAH